MRPLLAIAVAACIAAGAPAAEITRPVRLVLPFPPGGGSDTLARILSPRLSEATGRQWVVDNRSGAGGNIAMEIVAKAPPDGSTVLLALNSLLTMNPAVYPELRVNPQTDLQPITQLSLGQFIVALNPAVPAANVKELIELARGKPGMLRYASCGPGCATHLAGELLKSLAKIDLVHVPYKGAGPSVLATITGEVQLVFSSVAGSMPHVRSGRLKAIAVSGLKRSAVAPDLPTLNEAGVAGFNIVSWHALLVPARTPAAVVSRLDRAAREAAQVPAVSEAMAREGMEPTTRGPAELAALIASETAMWRGVIKAAGIRGE